MKNLLMLLSFTLALTGVTLAAAQTVEVEISENMNAFVFDTSHVDEDGLPAHGSGFVTQGYVYPKGTLDGSNGVLADGSAEFPDAVIGEWICYGYMINGAAKAEGGPWVISTQVINFTAEHGEQTLITTGYELIDIGVPVLRAISGGTGDYATARGQATQILTGFNAGEGVVLSMTLEPQMPDAMSDTVQDPYAGLQGVERDDVVAGLTGR